MLKTKYNEPSVKYTTVLPKGCLDALRELSEKNIISSVNHGIRTAVEEFVAQLKKQEYILSVREAANDEAFLKRTADAHSDFINADADMAVNDEW